MQTADVDYESPIKIGRMVRLSPNGPLRRIVRIGDGCFWAQSHTGTAPLLVTGASYLDVDFYPEVEATDASR